MSYRSPAWDTLGIEPTEDRRAIRVAYARRLKEIDVDADPQAFIALREAFEDAQQEAEHAEMMRQWAEDAEVDGAPEEDESETVDPDDIATELAYQKQALPYRALPPAPDRLTAPDDPRWIEAAPASDPMPEPARATSEVDRWEAPEVLTEPEPAAEPAAPPPDDRWELREPEPGPEPPEPLPRHNPWAQAPAVDVDAHVQALLRLLHELQTGEGEPPGEWRAQMLEHWRVIAGDPRLQEIGHFADAESWWSDVIARTIPWSDPLVRPAVELFGWLEQADHVTQLPAAAHVVRRLHSLEFYHAVQQRKHPLNAAWRELVKPAQEGSWRGWVNSVRVRELLATVREHYPDLESCFDWYRVGIWEGRVTSPGGGYSWSGKSGGGGGFPAWAWIVLVILAIRLLGSLGGMDKPSTALPPIAVEASQFGELNDLPRDLGAVLVLIGGSNLDWSKVQQSNPKLAMMLQSNWMIARENKERRFAFAMRMRKLLLERYNAALLHADHPAVSEYRRILLEEAKHLKQRSNADCDKFFRGELASPPDLPDAVRDRERALIARVLLASSDPVPVKRNGKFSIPTSVGEKAAHRAGMTEEQFYAALNNRGTATNRCAGRIALIETALELPPSQGLPLLREM